MPIPFHPADVDVSADPGYAEIVDGPGPRSHTTWSEPGAVTRAKHLEMFEVDLDMHARWESTMRALLDADLPDDEFTAERMLRLKRWLRERKRLQHNLHYKYDMRRRKPHLVERDVRKQLTAAKLKLEALGARLEAKASTPAPAPPTRSTVPAEPRLGPVVVPAPAPAEEPKTPRQLFLMMVASDTGIQRPEAAADSDIIAAYVNVSQSPEDGQAAGEWVVREIRGVAHP